LQLLLVTSFYSVQNKTSGCVVTSFYSVLHIVSLLALLVSLLAFLVSFLASLVSLLAFLGLGREASDGGVCCDIYTCIINIHRLHICMHITQAHSIYICIYVYIYTYTYSYVYNVRFASGALQRMGGLGGVA